MDYPVDVGILASYFGFIALLLWRISPTLAQAFQHKQDAGTLIFGVGALLSLLATWTYMLKYFQHSYNEWQAETRESFSLNAVSHWLHSVSLFDDAWRTVSLGDWPWLFSHRLCLFTVGTWTPFLALEGSRRHIPFAWAYMLLGQVVAISTSSALFFAVVLAYKKTDRASLPSPIVLLVCVWVGMATVVASPFVADTIWFMPNLLVMHGVLIIPLFERCTGKFKLGHTQRSVAITAIYITAAACSFAITLQHWFTCLRSITDEDQSLSSLPWLLIATFFRHPAQSSISSDVVAVDILCCLWMVVDRMRNSGQVPKWTLALMLLTPSLSASVTFPLFLAAVEYQDTLMDKNKST